MELVRIAVAENDYTSKFGVPRQSGLVGEVITTIVFEEAFRSEEALRGLEEFSHIWLIWGFDRAERKGWSPTVRPPRLGGNTRVGVFATRSPYRPNGLGLSCVRLLEIRKEPGKGTVLKVAGADLMNGTPIYDIKPYLPYADAQAEATGGFTDRTEKRRLRVFIPAEMRKRLGEETAASLEKVLEQDPRPAYQDDPERIYGFEFGGKNIRFRVREDTAEVTDVEKSERPR